MKIFSHLFLLVLRPGSQFWNINSEDIKAFGFLPMNIIFNLCVYIYTYTRTYVCVLKFLSAEIEALQVNASG